MTDDRAVATSLNYVLGLGIAFILVTGLLIAGGNFVQDQRESAARTELQVLGQQVAADISMADRLAQTTQRHNRTVVVRRNLPNSVAGSGYSIAVEGQQHPYLRLETTSPEVSVRVNVTNRTDLAMTEVSGGSIAVNYTDDDELRLEGS